MASITSISNLFDEHEKKLFFFSLNGTVTGSQELREAAKKVNIKDNSFKELNGFFKAMGFTFYDLAAAIIASDPSTKWLPTKFVDKPGGPLNMSTHVQAGEFTLDEIITGPTINVLLAAPLSPQGLKKIKELLKTGATVCVFHQGDAVMFDFPDVPGYTPPNGVFKKVVDGVEKHAGFNTCSGSVRLLRELTDKSFTGIPGGIDWDKICRGVECIMQKQDVDTETLQIFERMAKFFNMICNDFIDSDNWVLALVLNVMGYDKDYILMGAERHNPNRLRTDFTGVDFKTCCYLPDGNVSFPVLLKPHNADVNEALTYLFNYKLFEIFANMFPNFKIHEFLFPDSIANEQPLDCSLLNLEEGIVKEANDFAFAVMAQTTSHEFFMEATPEQKEFLCVLLGISSIAKGAEDTSAEDTSSKRVKLM